MYLRSWSNEYIAVPAGISVRPNTNVACLVQKVNGALPSPSVFFCLLEGISNHDCLTLDVDMLGWSPVKFPPYWSRCSGSPAPQQGPQWPRYFMLYVKPTHAIGSICFCARFSIKYLTCASHILVCWIFYCSCPTAFRTPIARLATLGKMILTA